MTWLAWRQFRAQAAVAVAATLAVVIVLVATRGHVADSADPGALENPYKAIRLLGTLLIGVPAFIGAFWGAPLLARELEAGTHRLAWTQSVTRRRWLAIKLGVVGAAAVIVTVAFSSFFTWWSLPFDEVGNRIGTANFGQRGIVPVAYAVFAVVLGTLFGTVIRRTLPAMAATLAGFFVVRYGFQLLVRPHLLAPVTASRPSTLFGPPEGVSPASGGWVLSSKSVDATGRVVSNTEVDRLIAASCRVTRASTPDDLSECVNRLGIHDVVRMQPGSRFWALQSWESASFLALSVVLGAVCFWWVRHRTA